MKFKKETRIVQTDKWDEQIYEDISWDIKQVRDNRDELWERHNFVDDAFADLFMSLFLGDPINNESRDIQEDHVFNERIVTEFQGWQEVDQLRVDSKFDEYSSAFAMIQLHEPIKKLYEENAALMELIAAMTELLKQLSESSGGQEAGEIQGEINKLSKLIGEAMGGIKIDFRGAVKKASEDLEQEASLMRTFGLEEGQLQRMSFQERRTLAEQLKTGKMLQFANLLGQFRLVAKGARRSKVSTVPDEIAGLEMGRDLGNMSIESLISLAVPEMELKFWSDFMNFELIQKRVVGPHSLGRGDIVFIMDESGSMGEYCYGGTREMWGKALALALLSVCRQSKRTFTYLGFSGHTNFRKHTFIKGRVDPKEMIAMVEGFYCGGTYPYTALMEAIKIVEAAPTNRRPDVVFLSDGEFGQPSENFYEEWNRVKKKTDMQSFGVAFDYDPKEMTKLVDTVVPLESLHATPETMSNIFKALQS